LPVWEAYYVVAISSQTGWSEDFIRHQLPLSRGMAYYHAIRVAAGERCRWPGEASAISKHIDNVRNWIRKVTRKSTRGQG